MDVFAEPPVSHSTDCQPCIGRLVDQPGKTNQHVNYSAVATAAVAPTTTATAAATATAANANLSIDSR